MSSTPHHPSASQAFGDFNNVVLVSLQQAFASEQARFQELQKQNADLTTQKESLIADIQAKREIDHKLEDIIIQHQKILAALEAKVARKKRTNKELNDKLHHLFYNSPTLSKNAKELKKYARRAMEDGDELEHYCTMLDNAQQDLNAEMEMYGEVSD